MTMDEEADDEVPMAISLGVDWCSIASQTNQTIVSNLSCLQTQLLDPRVPVLRFRQLIWMSCSQYL